MADESQNSVNSTKSNPITTLLDHDKNTSLHYSAARGINEDFAKLTGNQNVDPQNYLGWTPLMMACKRGHISTVKLLLQLSADATKTNKYGMSVFLISVSGGNLQIVKIILQHLLEGGTSKRIMQTILSPLSLSILFKHHDILEFLIGQKFDLNAATPFTGVTPLMFASAMEDNHAFTLLIQNKADQTVKNYLGYTAHSIQKSRKQKQQSHKPKPLKLTPAEMISRSPHMAPNCLFSPMPTFINLNPSQLLYVKKSPNTLCPTPTIFFTSPNITPIPQMAITNLFFPENFSNNHMALSPNGFPNFFSNENAMNRRINCSESELILSPYLN